jgi:hypothetical protein
MYAIFPADAAAMAAELACYFITALAMMMSFLLTGRC